MTNILRLKKRRVTKISLYKNQIKNLKTCETCKGVGLIKYEDIIINEIRYKPCSPEGFVRMPYDECNICYGSGKIND